MGFWKTKKRLGAVEASASGRQTTDWNRGHVRTRWGRVHSTLYKSISSPPNLKMRHSRSTVDIHLPKNSTRQVNITSCYVNTPSGGRSISARALRVQRLSDDQSFFVLSPTPQVFNVSRQQAYVNLSPLLTPAHLLDANIMFIG